MLSRMLAIVISSWLPALGVWLVGPFSEAPNVSRVPALVAQAATPEQPKVELDRAA